MNESHSKAINQNFNDFPAKVALASKTSTNYQNIKENGQIRPIPIYIYDAPNGLGLSILQAIFQVIINPFHPSHIYSAYILPDNLNRIFFEALDLKSVRKVLHYISGIKSVPKNLPVIRGDQINQYFVNPVGCLHFHPGQIVTIRNPEFDNQIGQIVDIKKETGKLLIKTYPHIDYNFLRKHPNYTTQSKINEIKGPDYKAPMVPFEKEGLTTTNSSMPIWNNQVNGVKWDNKFFIGKFQYIWISNKEIFHKNLETVTNEEKRIFSEGITDYERMNSFFMNGFNGHLNFEGTHDSDIILSLSLNKGKPSWANKNDQSKNSSSDSSSDSELKSNSSLKNDNSKSQYLKNPSNLTPSRNVQFSQSRKAILPDFSIDDDDSFDSTPALPDFDDDDNDNDDNNNNIQSNNNGKSRIPNSPVFVGSSSSEEDEKKPNSKSKSNYKSNSKQNNTSKIFGTSSDSDIDSLFDTSTTTKTKSSKKSSSKQSSQANKAKTKNNSTSSTKKSTNESSKKERSKNTEKDNGVNVSHLSKFFSSDLSSDEEAKKKPSAEKQSKNKSSTSSGKVAHTKSSNDKQKQKKKDHLADSSNSSNSDAGSHPKSFLDLSVSSDSSDVEIIEPKKQKKGKKNKEKESMKPIINELIKDSVDFGDSSPSEKTFFGYVSSSDNEDDKGVEFEPVLDKESILEELSQQISKKKMRKYYKRKGMPVPKEYASDSYSVDSDSSSSSSS